MTGFALIHVAAAYGFAVLTGGWTIGGKFAGGWRWIVLAIAIGAVLLNVGASLLTILAGANTDWRILAEAGRRAGTPALYEVWDDGPYRYSPLYAWMLVPLGWIGHWGWVMLHVAVLPLFRDWRVSGLLFISWPFWFDAVNGNVLTFVLLAAWWALRGNGWATFAYLALTLLMPRPVMAPVALWLLWHRPEWRLPFGAIFMLHAGLVAWSGLADEWLPTLFAATDMLPHPLNFGPSRLVGAAWIPIGLALACLALWRGRIGLASVAASPYLIPYYWLFALLDLPREQVVRAFPRVAHIRYPIPIYRLRPRTALRVVGSDSEGSSSGALVGLDRPDYAIGRLSVRHPASDPTRDQ